MNRYDRISTIFFLVMALGICLESTRMGLGSLSNPGPGLLPLGCGLILGILSLIVFARTFQKADAQRAILWQPGTRWRNLFLAVFSLIGYAFLIDLLGFHFITFVWTSFVCRCVGRMRWKTALITSVVATASSYLLFEQFLTVRFPKGIWSF